MEAITITLELNDVIALLSNDSRSLRATGVDIAVSISTALAAAFSKDSEIVVGWIPAEQQTRSYIWFCHIWVLAIHVCM